MSNVLYHIIKCLHIPYFAILITALLLVFFSKKRVYLAIILLMMIMWRLFFHITSSRYCNSFLIASLCIPLLTLRNIHVIVLKPAYNLGLLLIVFLLSFNIIKSFSPFRDLYVFDTKEEINHVLSKDKQSFILIQGNEYNRLKQENTVSAYRQQAIDWDVSNNIIKDIFERFSYWNGNVYIVFSSKTLRSSFIIDSHSPYDSKTIGKHIRNQKGNSILSFVLYRPSQPPKHIQLVNSIDNQIKNGDMETLQEPNVSKHKLRMIISEGNSFYQQDEVILPDFDILLPTWKKYEENKYPEVFIDKKNVINGEKSLHVIFPANNIAGGDLYLLNHIKKMDGRLSFNIQNLCKPGIISINVRETSSDNRVSSPVQTYYYNLFDQSVHKVQIEIQEESIRTDRFVFSIYGKGMEVLIDDIFFSSK